MSAQGGTIAGRTPMQVPNRLIALLIAIATAAAVGMTAVRLASDDGKTAPAVSKVQFSGPTSHPAIRGRHGDHAVGMPVQRLYPDGFGDKVAKVEERGMPVQRLYPDGFGDKVEDRSTPIFDGRRRKWGR